MDIRGTIGTQGDGNVTITTGPQADTVLISGVVDTRTIVAVPVGNVTVSTGAGNDFADVERRRFGSGHDQCPYGDDHRESGDGADQITTGNAGSSAVLTASQTVLNGQDGTGTSSDGNDTFNVRPLSTTPFMINGEIPHLTTTGDNLESGLQHDP